MLRSGFVDICSAWWSLSHLGRSVTWCPQLIWENGHYCFKYFFFFSFFVFWYPSYVYLIPFIDVLQSLDILLFYYGLCSLCFSVFEDFIYIQTQRFFSQMCPTHTGKHIKAILAFLFFVVLSQNSNLCLHCPSVLVYCILYQSPECSSHSCFKFLL